MRVMVDPFVKPGIYKVYHYATTIIKITELRRLADIEAYFYREFNAINIRLEPADYLEEYNVTE